MDLPIHYPSTPFQQRRLVREEYIRRQQGKCYHCQSDLIIAPPDEVTRLKVNRALFPPNFFKWPVHLHHDHNTGLTIGAVHNYCNAVLWQYHGE